MSVRRKTSISPLRQQFPASDGIRRRSLGPDKGRREVPPGYCVEWNTHTRRRHGLVDSRDLRSQILTEEQRGMERMFVLYSLEGRIPEMLSGVGGVDPGFLDAHARRKGYRAGGMAAAPAGAPRWWSWEYPEGLGKRSRDGCGDHVSFCRASLWSSSYVTVLLVNRPEAPPPARVGRTVPRLRHQDAATRMSRLKAGGHYVTADEGYAPRKAKQPSMGSEIYETLGGPQPLEQVLGELVYHRWLDFLDTLGPRSCRSCHQRPLILWTALASLEQNQDSSRYLNKANRPLETPSHADWTDLIARVHRRLTLLVAAPQQQQSSPPSSSADDANTRSLDRLAYLGGLLLPLTVVSGVLAIEGDYGPEGGNFWVFWVASAAASAVAVLVIYLDEMRSLHVWIEVAVADAMMEEDSVVGAQEADGDQGKGPGGSGLVVERLKDGELVRAWRRTELGWRGAVKKASGYYRWRGLPGIQFEAPRTDSAME